MENQKNCKRKAESLPDDEQSQSKKSRDSIPHLLDLSDDVLLLIFGYLSTSDLLNASESCTRLLQISSDTSLWTKIDTVSEPQSIKRFRKFLKFMTDRTTSVSIGGDLRVASITPSLLEAISVKCPKLEEFVLDGCYVDAESITISQFPRNIKRLALRNCSIVNISPKRSYLFEMDKMFTSLQFLDLENGNWLSNHSLQSISKSQSLHEVNFRGCRQLGECFVYSALSTRLGFRNVRTIDLRDTHVGDSEVPCFGRLPNITHLYLGRTDKDESLSPPAGFESSGKITDRGVISMCLSELEGGKLLEVLALLQSDITNRSLMKLAAAFNLKKLDLRGCSNITSEGIQSYLLRHPTCQVIYSNSY